MSYNWLFFGFSGRFSPRRYWGGLAMCLFLWVADNVQFGIFASAMPTRGFTGLVWASIGLACVLLPYTVYLLATIHIRRLHDIGLSGFYLVPAVVTVVGLVPLVLICGFRSGTSGPNKFGADPTFDPLEVGRTFTDEPPG